MADELGAEAPCLVEMAWLWASQEQTLPTGYQRVGRVIGLLT